MQYINVSFLNMPLLKPIRYIVLFTLCVLVFSGSNAHAEEFVINGDFNDGSTGWILVYPEYTQMGGGLLRMLNYKPVEISIRQTTTLHAIKGEEYTVSLYVSTLFAGGQEFGYLTVISDHGLGVATLGPILRRDFGRTISKTFVASATGPLHIAIRQQMRGIGVDVYVESISVQGPAFSNTTPTITSDPSFAINEGSVHVGTAQASDPDSAGVGQTLSWRIVPESENPASIDADKVTIDAQSGEISMIDAPDFENPDDANGDRVYDVVIEVSDDASPVAGTTTQHISIAVNDLQLSINSAITGDADTNGKLDFFDVTFSLDIDDTALDASGADFTISDSDGVYSITQATETAPGVVRLTVEEKSNPQEGGTGETPLIAIATGKSIISTSVTGGEVLNSTSTYAHITASDAVSPLLTEVTPIATTTATNTPSYTFHTSEDGVMSYTGGCSSTTTTAIQGDNTITFNTLSDGTYTACSITITDAHGLRSEPLTLQPFTVNAKNPVATITQKAAQQDPTTDTSATFLITFDEVIDSSSLDVSDFEVILTDTLTFDTSTLTEVSGTTQTTFELTFDTLSGEGDITVRLPDNTVTDTFNNPNSATIYSDNTITRDTTPPNAPTITHIIDDTGASSTDFITHDTALQYWGITPDTASRIEVYQNNTLIGEAVITNDTWQFDHTSTSLAEGSYTVSARAYDKAGNASESAVIALHIDTTPPAAPQITNPSNGTQSNTPQIIEGTAESDVRITVQEGAEEICTTTTNTNGAWSCVPTFSHTSGVYTIDAVATDIAGNTSTTSDAVIFDVPAPVSTPTPAPARTDGGTIVGLIQHASVPEIQTPSEETASTSITIDTSFNEQDAPAVIPTTHNATTATPEPALIAQTHVSVPHNTEKKQQQRQRPAITYNIQKKQVAQKEINAHYDTALTKSHATSSQQNTTQQLAAVGSVPDNAITRHTNILLFGSICIVALLGAYMFIIRRRN